MTGLNMLKLDQKLEKYSTVAKARAVACVDNLGMKMEMAKRQIRARAFEAYGRCALGISGKMSPPKKAVCLLNNI
jgi:hypothetical protein